MEKYKLCSSHHQPVRYIKCVWKTWRERVASHGPATGLLLLCNWTGQALFCGISAEMIFSMRTLASKTCFKDNVLFASNAFIHWTPPVLASDKTWCWHVAYAWSVWKHWALSLCSGSSPASVHAKEKEQKLMYNARFTKRKPAAAF